MEKYLEGETLTQEEIEGLLSRAIAKRLFVPVFVGSCIKEQGVNSLMDDIATYFPASHLVYQGAHGHNRTGHGAGQRAHA